ncbi:hypothetical protein ZWY2020_049234 [Hordeum vulgare]|nr:hypothetical protein ZWY2020_049234 [Hordeum vulgare]
MPSFHHQLSFSVPHEVADGKANTATNDSSGEASLLGFDFWFLASSQALALARSLRHERAREEEGGREVRTREAEAAECRAGEWEEPLQRRTPDERGGCGAPARSAAPPAAGRHFQVSALVQGLIIQKLGLPGFVTASNCSFLLLSI